MFLSGYDISPALAMKIYKEYKDRICSIIVSNPYKIAEDVPGVGFKMADSIAMKTGITADSEYRIRAAVIYTLSQIGLDGHMYLPKDILRTLLQADAVYCEVPFCYRDEEQNTLWNGIMDVIYAENDRWHIVDYKTNADGSDLDTKYQGQLAAYIQAFRKITGETADARTYHIDI